MSDTYEVVHFENSDEIEIHSRLEPRNKRTVVVVRDLQLAHKITDMLNAEKYKPYTAIE